MKKDMSIGYEMYQELADRVMSADATQEDINRLGKWFENFGSDFWNGECYEIDSTHALYAIYNEDADDADWDIIGYEIR